MTDGFLIVDKPAGITSHQVVARVRRALGTKKVGHAGTLDPMATGVLVVGIGRGTRLLGHIALTTKTYEATIRLGQASVTDDADGEITASVGATLATLGDRVTPAMAALTGEIDQVPSAVSAIKVAGRRAYALVRRGEEVALPARRVTVTRFDALHIREDVATLPTASEGAAGNAAGANPPGGPTDLQWTTLGDQHRVGTDQEGTAGHDQHDVTTDQQQADNGDQPARTSSYGRHLPVVDIDVVVDCSSGTYIRALARDLGATLGVGGHLTRLRRTAVGPFALEHVGWDAQLGQLQPGELVDLPLTDLADIARLCFATIEVDAGAARDVGYGRALRVGVPGSPTAILHDGRLLALYSPDGEHRAVPLAVLA